MGAIKKAQRLEKQARLRAKVEQVDHFYGMGYRKEKAMEIVGIEKYEYHRVKKEMGQSQGGEA